MLKIRIVDLVGMIGFGIFIGVFIGLIIPITTISVWLAMGLISGFALFIVLLLNNRI